MLTSQIELLHRLTQTIAERSPRSRRYLPCTVFRTEREGEFIGRKGGQRWHHKDMVACAHTIKQNNLRALTPGCHWTAMAQPTSPLGLEMNTLNAINEPGPSIKSQLDATDHQGSARSMCYSSNESWTEQGTVRIRIYPHILPLVFRVFVFCEVYLSRNIPSFG